MYELKVVENAVERLDKFLKNLLSIIDTLGKIWNKLNGTNKRRKKPKNRTVFGKLFLWLFIKIIFPVLIYLVVYTAFSFIIIWRIGDSYHQYEYEWQNNLLHYDDFFYLMCLGSCFSVFFHLTYRLRNFGSRNLHIRYSFLLILFSVITSYYLTFFVGLKSTEWFFPDTWWYQEEGFKKFWIFTYITPSTFSIPFLAILVQIQAYLLLCINKKKYKFINSNSLEFRVKTISGSSFNRTNFNEYKRIVIQKDDKLYRKVDGRNMYSEKAIKQISAYLKKSVITK